jgi:hypothetical protein
MEARGAASASSRWRAAKLRETGRGGRVRNCGRTVTALPARAVSYGYAIAIVYGPGFSPIC